MDASVSGKQHSEAHSDIPEQGWPGEAVQAGTNDFPDWLVFVCLASEYGRAKAALDEVKERRRAYLELLRPR